MKEGNKNDPNINYNFGRAYQELGDFKNAIEHFEKILNTHSDQDKVRQRLSECYEILTEEQTVTEIVEQIVIEPIVIAAQTTQNNSTETALTTQTIGECNCTEATDGF